MKAFSSAMMVMNCTLVSSGRFAMCQHRRADVVTSISRLRLDLAFAWGTPSAMREASGVRALPMSIWPQAMSYFCRRASSIGEARHACLVEV